MEGRMTYDSTLATEVSLVCSVATNIALILCIAAMHTNFRRMAAIAKQLNAELERRAPFQAQREWREQAKQRRDWQ
jgi:hypothetical protein